MESLEFIINETTVYNILRILHNERMIDAYNKNFILQNVGQNLINIANNLVLMTTNVNFVEFMTRYQLMHNASNKLILNKMLHLVLNHHEPNTFMVGCILKIDVEICVVRNFLFDITDYGGGGNYGGDLINVLIGSAIMYAIYESFFDKSKFCFVNGIHDQNVMRTYNKDTELIPNLTRDN